MEKQGFQVKTRFSSKSKIFKEKQVFFEEKQGF